MPQKAAKKTAKKGQKALQTAFNSDTEDEYDSDTTVKSMSETFVANQSQREDDFADKLANALYDPRVIAGLNSVFSKNPIVQTLNDKISQLNEVIETKDKQIQKLTEEMDELKQNNKRNTVRIEGLPEKENASVSTSEVVCKLATEKLNVDLFPSDIDTCFRVGKNKSPDKTRPVVLRFVSHDKKREVMSNKKKLREERGTRSGPGPIYINDDLTDTRAYIFKCARQAVKDKHLNSAWSLDGRIFIKKKQDDDPFHVKTLSSLNAILAQIQAK